MYMFCRDSKLLGMEKMRRQFCIDPMESALNAYCSEVQCPITPIFTPYIVFRQVNAWGKNQRRKLFECKVIKGHSILYRQPMEINV